jgi:ubiquinone/menaquinone biosynthesis C-methylase UbiE
MGYLRPATRIVEAVLRRWLRRSDYRQVWDWQARSARNARLVVSGSSEAADHDASGQATARDVIAETAVTEHDVVLEIGCGVGRVGKHMAPRCARWIGADVSGRMLEHARTTLTGASNAAFHRLSGFDLTGIPDASVDVVYCTGVFMHLDEWERYSYTTDAYRVLKPGGRVYIDNFGLATPAGWQFFRDIQRLSPEQRPPQISRASTGEELRTYAERAGFAAIRLRSGELWITLVAMKPVV